MIKQAGFKWFAAALVVCTGLPSFSDDEPKNPPATSRTRPSYNKSLRFHKVQIPEFEKQIRNAEDGVGDRTFNRFRIPIPGEGTVAPSPFQAPPSTPVPPPKKEKKKKNWILPPVPDDLKDKISRDQDPIEPSGWGWLADQTVFTGKEEKDPGDQTGLNSRNSEEKEDESDRETWKNRSERSGQTRTRDRNGFHPVSNYAGFSSDEEDLKEKARNSMARQVGSIAEKEKEAQREKDSSWGVGKSGAFQDGDSWKGPESWKASRTWSMSSPASLSMPETESILSKYRTSTVHSKPSNSDVRTGANGFNVETRLSSSSQKILSNFFEARQLSEASFSGFSGARDVGSGLSKNRSGLFSGKATPSTIRSNPDFTRSFSFEETRSSSLTVPSATKTKTEPRRNMPSLRKETYKPFEP